MQGPLDRVEEWMPAGVREVVERETPIPTIAAAAARRIAEGSDLVRADIGQIAGLDPELEILYGPPAGLAPLRAAIAETWNRCFGLVGTEGLEDGLGAANVCVSTGAAEALALIFKCFAHDRLVGLPRAHWENYANGVALAGGRTTFVEFFDDAGRLDVESVARQVEAEGIAVLVANFPCNPTGAVLEDDEMAALAGMARELGLVLVADEVYARLRFDERPPVTLLKHAPERTIVVCSASKEYLMPGARSGYALCARPDFTDRILSRLVRAASGSANVLGQRRLLEFLEGELEDLRAGRPAALLTRIRDAMRERRDALIAVLERHGFTLAGRAGHAPEGTIFLMAGLPEWWAGDDATFCQASLEADCVSVVPGSSFGMPGAARFSFGSMTLEDIGRLDGKLDALRDA